MRSLGSEQPGALTVSSLSCNVLGCSSVRQREAGVGSAREEQPDQVRIAVHGGAVKRREAAFALPVRVSARFEQQARALAVAAEHRRSERADTREAILRPPLEVCTASDERLGDGRAAREAREMEW